MIKKFLLRKLNKNERLIFIASLGVAILALSSYVAKPNNIEITNLKNEIKSLEKSLKLLQKPVVAGSKEIRAQIENLGKIEDLLKVSEKVISPIQVKDIDLLESRFLPIESENKIFKSQINLKFNGEYEHITSYIRHLETMSPPLIIRNFIIKKDINNETLINIEIKGSIYASN